MEGQFKKIFSIGGALLLGIIIVFFAWKSGSLTNIPLGSEKNIPQENGTLSVVPGAPSTQRTLGVWRTQEGTRDLSTSTTDILAYELITNYASTQKKPGVALNEAEVQAQAEALTKKVQLAQGPQYKLSDLVISLDNSHEANAAYGALVSTLIRDFNASQVTGDFMIIFESPQKMSDTAKRVEIAKNIAHYQILVRGLLAVKTPSEIAPLHLGLIQTYSNMQNSLTGLVEIFNDPMRGLAALTQYRNAVEDLTILTGKYIDFAAKNKL